MDQETLFTASKWTILQLLSEEPLSPIELAARSHTSVANVSQQLRLLEMAGLVRSERISNRDKGQPRILYSLAGNNSFLISTSDAFVDKKLFRMSKYNKIVMRIWFYHKPELHYYLEKSFWHIDEHLPKIDALAVDENADNPLKFIVFSRNKELAQHLKPVTITNGTEKRVEFEVVHSDTPGKKIAERNLYQLYDPGNIIPGIRGGNNDA